MILLHTLLVKAGFSSVQSTPHYNESNLGYLINNEYSKLELKYYFEQNVYCFNVGT